MDNRADSSSQWPRRPPTPPAAAPSPNPHSHGATRTPGLSTRTSFSTASGVDDRARSNFSSDTLDTGITTPYRQSGITPYSRQSLAASDCALPEPPLPSRSNVYSNTAETDYSIAAAAARLTAAETGGRSSESGSDSSNSASRGPAQRQADPDHIGVVTLRGDDDERAVAVAGGERTYSLSSSRVSILQEKPALRWDSEGELVKVSKGLLCMQKWCLCLGIICTNAALIYLAWTYSKYHYIFLPLLCANTFLQCGMIICLFLHTVFTGLRRLFRRCVRRVKSEEGDPEKGGHPGGVPEKIVCVLPCYNETREEIERAMDSLVSQNNIADHPKLIVIIVDGNAKAAGMEKTTQEYLLDDILPVGTRRDFSNGYRARDGLFMACTIQEGMYKDTPYILVAKRYNQGKRDSLCFVRSFLYNYHNRNSVAAGTEVSTIFNPALFAHLAGIMVERGLPDVDYLVGMDADTVFDDNCIWEMIRAIRKAGPRVVGVCGHVCVAYEGKDWGFWNLYQSIEYSATQGLRRMFQSRITGKVNCLPGCCQLIRVEEATFGDEVLRERFGYVPKPNDMMTQHIMGNYSEDSIHASLIFSVFPKKQTAQALRAKAYTGVPQNWTVFLSQRKRWSLGSISNEFVMIFRPGIILIERLQSIITVITWWIMPFILAAVIALIFVLVKQGKKVFEDALMLVLVAVLGVRYIYTFCIVFWLPTNTKERMQYVVGFFMHFFTSPFVNFVVTIYSMFNSDDFKWGKTRESVDPETERLIEGDEKRPTMF